MRPNPFRLIIFLTARSLRPAACTPLWTFLLMGAFLLPGAVSEGAGNAARGEKVYRTSCFACHGVDPAKNGPLGPAIKGSSKALLTIRLQKGGKFYPPGYKPKRKTAVMPPMAHLLPNVDDLLAYINKGQGSAAGKKRRLSRKRKESKPKSWKRRVAQGKALFTMTCGGCHQPDGRGKVGLAPSITDQDFLALVSNRFIRNTIRKGRPGTNMISFSFLGNEKIAAIATYLRSFQKVPSRKYNRRWRARGSPRRGKALYDAICSQCHGINGKGYLLGGSGTGIGLNGFLKTAGDAYIRQVLLSGREGTPMRAFGGPDGLANLSPRDMRDIIVYLRALGKKNARKR